MKKKDIMRLVIILILALLGGAVGYFAARGGMIISPGKSPSVVVAVALFFIPCFFFTIALHEAGHAIAGITANFDFRLYVVGPFMWEKNSDGWKFHWNRNVNTSGGLVICVPTDSNNIRQRFALYSAGGPIGSLVTVVAMWLVAKSLTAIVHPLVVVQIVIALCWVMCVLSLLIFILTALPFHTNGFSSDGARVIRLYRGGDVAQFEVLLLKIVSTSCSGVRPSQWNMSEVEDALQLGTKINAPMVIYMHSYHYHYAFDVGDLDKAELHLANYVREEEAIPGGFRAAVPLEAAFFYAFAKQDLEKALPFWNRYKSSAIIPKSSEWATEAAISLLQGDKEKARLLIEKALKEIPNMMDRGVGKALEERLVVMKVKAER